MSHSALFEQVPKTIRRVAERLRERVGGTAILVGRNQERATELDALAGEAAKPATHMEPGDEAVIYELDVPGAAPWNTELVWDALRERLVLGVWVSGVPVEPKPGRALTWYSSTWFPQCDGIHARASIHDHILHVELPLKASYRTHDVPED